MNAIRELSKDQPSAESDIECARRSGHWKAGHGETQARESAKGQQQKKNMPLLLFD
jgi:hypothetical protein